MTVLHKLVCKHAAFLSSFYAETYSVPFSCIFFHVNLHNIELLLPAHLSSWIEKVIALGKNCMYDVWRGGCLTYRGWMCGHMPSWFNMEWQGTVLTWGWSWSLVNIFLRWVEASNCVHTSSTLFLMRNLPYQSLLSFRLSFFLGLILLLTDMLQGKLSISTKIFNTWIFIVGVQSMSLSFIEMALDGVSGMDHLKLWYIWTVFFVDVALNRTATLVSSLLEKKISPPLLAICM